MIVAMLVRHGAYGVQAALTLLAFRMFPVVVCLGASRAPLLHNVAAALAYATVARLATQYSNFHPTDVLIAYGYLSIAILAPYFLTKNRLLRRVIFPIVLGLLVGLPALAHGQFTSLVALLGWEAALSVYSYCVDHADAPGPVGEYMRFVLVNPALVYGRRGIHAHAPGLNAGGLFRVAAGVLMVALYGFVISATRTFAPGIILGFLGLAQVYLAHVGLANIQIGLMRQLGDVLPERYDRPLSATSPREFWRRWNTYVGSWARIYVFQPLAVAFGRRMRSLRGFRRNVTSALLIVVSFGAVGVLHDIYTSASERVPCWSSTVWFVANGCLVVLWEAVRVFLRRRDLRLPAVLARTTVMATAIVMLRFHD